MWTLILEDRKGFTASYQWHEPALQFEVAETWRNFLPIQEDEIITPTVNTAIFYRYNIADVELVSRNNRQ